MGYFITTNKNVIDKPKTLRHQPDIIYHQAEDNFQKEEGYFIEGYLKKGQNTIESKDLNNLSHKWPLPDVFSGSYAYTLITDNEIIIANDCIGVYPLFYHLNKGEFSVSNRLLDIQKALQLDIDEVAKTERLFAPENSEIGSRTLLKGVKRLLPGEKIVFNLKSKTLKKNV